LWTKKLWRKQAYLLTVIILMAPLPVALNSVDIWLMFRASFLIPFLIILSGLGLYALSQSSKKIKWLLILVYLIFASGFLYEYFMRYPLYGTKGNYFAKRVLASHLVRSPKTQKYLIIADENFFMFESMLVFNNLITKNNLSQIHEAYRTGNYELANFKIIGGCVDLSQIDEQTTIVADGTISLCEDKQAQAYSGQDTVIASLIDSGGIYYLYNDQVCNAQELNNYSRVTQNKFAVEELSTPEFCQNFLLQAEFTIEKCEAKSGVVIDESKAERCPAEKQFKREIDESLACCFES